jgi:hypothetical protein
MGAAVWEAAATITIVEVVPIFRGVAHRGAMKVLDNNSSKTSKTSKIFGFCIFSWRFDMCLKMKIEEALKSHCETARRRALCTGFFQLVTHNTFCG